MFWNLRDHHPKIHFILDPSEDNISHFSLRAKILAQFFLTFDNVNDKYQLWSQFFFFWSNFFRVTNISYGSEWPKTDQDARQSLMKFCPTNVYNVFTIYFLQGCVGLFVLQTVLNQRSCVESALFLRQGLYFCLGGKAA